MATKFKLDNPWWTGFFGTLGALAAVGMIGLLSQCSWISPTDDSDASAAHRSGVTVVTDHLTGCQYLKADGLAPRLDHTGKQICMGSAH